MPPAPKRDSQRRNRVTRKADKAAAGQPGMPVPADPSWHPIAQRMHAAIEVSGQSAFYEQVDWEMAYALCESMSREFNEPGPPRANAVMAWMKMSAALLLTEGDRRRARLELQRDEGLEGDEDVISELGEYRQRRSS